MQMYRCLLPLLAFAAAVGCGSGGDETNTSSAGGGAGGGAGGNTTTSSSSSSSSSSTNPADPVVKLVVDADRDGVVDPANPEDADHTLDFDDKRGASFLANLDDDDSDKVADCFDEEINGDADLEDLARVAVVAWPSAPDGATGKLTLDSASSEAVRVWKKGLDGSWTELVGSVGVCTAASNCHVMEEATISTDEVRAGLELGVEALRLRMSTTDAWTGTVELTYRVLESDSPGAEVFTNVTHPDGIDKAHLRLAPWVLFGNLSPFDTVWSSTMDTAFFDALSSVVTQAGLTMKGISNYDDQWVQDFFQTAWHAMPGKGGEVHGMRIANARPWSQGGTLPIEWLKKNYLGPDRGTLVIYKKANSGSSYDSHGNHDLIPPYEHNGEKWPLGRIITGSGVLHETWDFYDAQGVQGPHYVAKTSWLYVGHVDEFMSCVPAQTSRGWKVLVASPSLGRQLLLDAQAAGHGGVHMFIGKKRYNANFNLVSAEISVDQVLADVDLMQWSQEAQSSIDDDVAALKAEIGLSDDDFVPVPVLFEEIDGYKLAWSPGIVNLLHFNGVAVPPEPFGPVIDGADIFKADVQDRVGSAKNLLGKDGKGLTVAFVDDWYTYHILDGEVHCGSNAEASAPFADARWWEVAK